MMCRKKVIAAGKSSRTIVIPAGIKTGETVTLAMSRLMLIDPKGEVPEDLLLEFLENNIEPIFWPWLEEEKKHVLS